MCNFINNPKFNSGILNIIMSITDISTTVVIIFTHIWKQVRERKRKNTFKSLANIYFFILFFYFSTEKFVVFFLYWKIHPFCKTTISISAPKTNHHPLTLSSLESQIRTLRTIRAWTCKHWFSIRIRLSCLPTHPFFRLAAI